MSRRLPSSQRRVPSLDNNPYQATSPASSNNPQPQKSSYYYPHHHHPHYHNHGDQYQKQCRNSYLKSPQATADIVYSDETTDTYDYYYQQTGFQHSPLRESRNTDVTFSDDSGSTRLPYFEFDDDSNKRYSRTTISDRSFKRPKNSPDRRQNHTLNLKDLRKVYPNPENNLDQLYQEVPSPSDNVPVNNLPRRISTRASDRPQSSLSSGVTSAVVHGCGGRCQTFENVCYFFLQLMFTMGILIGISLYIAGMVLRKSAARNLQVLMYIGILLSVVSGLLLAIQYDARKTARNRKKAIQMAKRAPIQMENLHLRTNPLHNQPHIGWNVPNQRNSNFPQVHVSVNRPLPMRPTERDSPTVIEQPGIPWWRRKDLNTH
ncbi:uncharacterized protein LOC130450277 [Diorhabda sublineata]|uniref:uncharacterized protein LOC130450277 n=1 Tax=Diorhabda sublineata TaxID=1163346 RepID=UPI0024E151E8|nr:uncharacterized protein LOC130450277 [Diorhabda sublineata]XP_056644576.1 uncharacterized protein LOC130450277 [Diorhabda sublineata]